MKSFINKISVVLGVIAFIIIVSLFEKIANWLASYSSEMGFAIIITMIIGAIVWFSIYYPEKLESK